MLNEEGTILDEANVARLDVERFSVTTTTGDPSAVERWITRWLTEWRLDARILDVTGAFGAVELAGPRARDVLAALTDADVSSATIPFLGAGEVDVADVPTLVLRTASVGELGYEIHFPAAYGEHLWDAIGEAGAPWGLAPVGLEARRILRLEKQYPTIGRDTEAGSDPFAIGLGELVAGDEEDVLGMRALRERGTEPADRLVGFAVADGWLPPDGASVVRDGRRVGRVTTARRSPTVGSAIGLAWVPADLASDGSPSSSRYGGSHTVGTVHARAWYDPNDERPRS